MTIAAAHAGVTPTGLRPRPEECCRFCAASIALFRHLNKWVDVFTDDAHHLVYCYGGSIEHQPIRRLNQ
jgi:hypothetical protein